MMELPPRAAVTPFAPTLAAIRAMTLYWHGLAQSSGCGDAELLALAREAVLCSNAGAVSGAVGVAMARATLAARCTRLRL